MSGFIKLFFVLFILNPLALRAKSKNILHRDDSVDLNIIHFNDFHARFDETNPQGGTCMAGDTCIGGFSRLYRQIMDMLEENRNNTLLLNGGDNFQGTFWYTVGKWNITQEFLNKLPVDATVLGNHEFDDTVEGVIPFIKALKSPVIVSNINDSLVPEFQNIYSKSVVINRNGKKIGIIGVIDSRTNERANTGQLTFNSESPSVNVEADRLVREEGVFTNIVLSHCGYDKDKIMAANASESISLIVGADSHTFLYTGDIPSGPDVPEGPYPTIVKNIIGKDVLIVQASANCRYLGNITLSYDSNGNILSFEGAPIYLDSTKPQDPQINQDLEPWREMVNEQGNKVVGTAKVVLDRDSCRYSECTLGNLMTDAMIMAYTDLSEEWWTYSSIAIYNSGGLRTSIDVGDITYGTIMTSVPFENTINVGEIQGKFIKEALEKTLSVQSIQDLRLLQTSGLQYTINMTKPIGERIQSLKVRCQQCQIPEYTNIISEQEYRICFPSYFLNSGEQVNQIISRNAKNIQDGELDIDVVVKYFQNRSPIFQEEEGRIIFV